MDAAGDETFPDRLRHLGGAMHMVSKTTTAFKVGFCSAQRAYQPMILPRSLRHMGPWSQAMISMARFRISPCR